jgi:hypothetical protein
MKRVVSLVWLMRVCLRTLCVGGIADDSVLEREASRNGCGLGVRRGWSSREAICLLVYWRFAAFFFRRTVTACVSKGKALLLSTA